jgi:hypothetical protein
MPLILSDFAVEHSVGVGESLGRLAEQDHPSGTQAVATHSSQAEGLPRHTVVRNVDRPSRSAQDLVHYPSAHQSWGTVLGVTGVTRGRR